MCTNPRDKNIVRFEFIRYVYIYMVDHIDSCVYCLILGLILGIDYIIIYNTYAQAHLTVVYKYITFRFDSIRFFFFFSFFIFRLLILSVIGWVLGSCL